jgi:cysteine synthase B
MNILDTIGNTPLVKIQKLNPNPRVNIFAKLEGFNPTGSIKDRIALYSENCYAKNNEY